VNFKDLSDLFKFKQTALLVFTGIMSYAEAANPPRLDIALLVFLSMFLCVAGTTGINMVLDADIDAKMFRTKHRPIPTERIGRKEAALMSLALLILGLAVGFMVNIYVSLAGFLGFLIDIILYTVLLKKKNPISVVFGGFAGGMPALGGWAAATGSFGLGGVVLMLVVAVWSSLHIWTLAIKYVDDYRNAGIPMLPVVIGEKKASIFSIGVALIVASIAIYSMIFGLVSPFGLLISFVPLALAIVYLVKGLITGEYHEYAFKAFKFVNMFMGIYFLAVFLT